MIKPLKYRLRRRPLAAFPLIKRLYPEFFEDEISDLYGARPIDLPVSIECLLCKATVFEKLSLDCAHPLKIEAAAIEFCVAEELLRRHRNLVEDLVGAVFKYKLLEFGLQSSGIVKISTEIPDMSIKWPLTLFL